MDKSKILYDKRFAEIEAFENKIWLSSPTMHGEKMQYVKEAIETNWVSKVGKNINELEKMVVAYLGMDYAVALSCGTAALHLCVNLAAERANSGAKPRNN